MRTFTESEIESFSIDELKRLGFSYVPGPAIAPDGEAGAVSMVAEFAAPYGLSWKRDSYEDVVLKPALEQAVDRLNPAVAQEVRQEALKAVLAVYSPQLINANEAFHSMLAEGVLVTTHKDGQERGGAGVVGGLPESGGRAGYDSQGRGHLAYAGFREKPFYGFLRGKADS